MRTVRKIGKLALLLCTLLLLCSCAAAQQAQITAIQDIDSDTSLRIGVVMGSTQERVASERWGAERLYQYNNASEALQALEANKVDAVMTPDAAAMAAAAGNPRVAVLEEHINPLGAGLAVKKNGSKTLLLQQLNSFITTNMENGTLARIKLKWNDMDAPLEQVLDNDGSEGTLIVGAAVNGPPFLEQTSDGSFKGYDADVMTMFANQYNYNIKWEVINFAGLLAALDVGKIDVICSGFGITEERKEKVDFTEPYFVGYTAGLVRKVGIESSVGDNIGQAIYKNFIAKDRYLLVLRGIGVTLLVALLSVVFGSLLGAVICRLRIAKNAIACRIGIIYIAILRGIPSLVVLMLTFYVFFGNVDINPVYAAAIAFSLNFSAYAAEIFRTAITAVNKGQVEAAHAMGLTKADTFKHVVLPQAVKIALPIYTGEFVSLVKGTSIVGYVALVDLSKAMDIIRSQTFDAFIPLLVVSIIYFLLSYLLTAILGLLEQRTDPKKRREIRKRKEEKQT